MSGAYFSFLSMDEKRKVGLYCFVVICIPEHPVQYLRGKNNILTSSQRTSICQDLCDDLCRTVYFLVCVKQLPSVFPVCRGGGELVNHSDISGSLFCRYVCFVAKGKQRFALKQVPLLCVSRDSIEVHTLILPSW